MRSGCECKGESEEQKGKHISIQHMDSHAHLKDDEVEESGKSTTGLWSSSSPPRSITMHRMSKGAIHFKRWFHLSASMTNKLLYFIMSSYF